jgi:hypothetical protein
VTAGSRVLGTLLKSVSAPASPTATRRIVLRLSRRLAARLRKRTRNVRVRVTGRDAAGNAARPLLLSIRAVR